MDVLKGGQIGVFCDKMFYGGLYISDKKNAEFYYLTWFIGNFWFTSDFGETVSPQIQKRC